MSSSANAHGNDVKQRAFYPNVVPWTAYIDYYNSLSLGNLTTIYLYVNYIAGASPVNILLQIWRPIKTTDRYFELVWQVRTSVSPGSNSPSGALYRVCLCDNFQYYYMYIIIRILYYCWQPFYTFFL